MNAGCLMGHCVPVQKILNVANGIGAVEHRQGEGDSEPELMQCGPVSETAFDVGGRLIRRLR
jgi:hypothetical protein